MEGRITRKDDSGNFSIESEQGIVKSAPAIFFRLQAFALSFQFSTRGFLQTHRRFEVLPARKRTLRCRHCHLTLDGEELGDGYCPECYDRSGERRYEFDDAGSAGRWRGQIPLRGVRRDHHKFVARYGIVISSRAKHIRAKGARCLPSPIHDF